MTRGRVLVVATALVALVAATAALAAGPRFSVRLSGHTHGNKDSVVRLSVVKKGDGVRTVKRFRFKEIFATCKGKEQRISLKLTGRIPVENLAFKSSFGDGASGFVKVRGTTNREGTKVVGRVRSGAVSVQGLGICDVDATGFKAHG